MFSLEENEVDDIYLLDLNEPENFTGYANKFICYNRNPNGKRINDCVVRAISTALGMEYDDTKKYLHKTCLATPNAHYYNSMRTIEKALAQYPCIKQGAVAKGTSRWTVCDLAINYPNGIYIVFVAGHMTCVINGAVIDTWDCSNKTIYRIWTIKGDQPNLVGKRRFQIL